MIEAPEAEAEAPHNAQRSQGAIEAKSRMRVRGRLQKKRGGEEERRRGEGEEERHSYVSIQWLIHALQQHNTLQRTLQHTPLQHTHDRSKHDVSLLRFSPASLVDPARVHNHLPALQVRKAPSTKQRVHPEIEVKDVVPYIPVHGKRGRVAAETHPVWH